MPVFNIDLKPGSYVKIGGDFFKILSKDFLNIEKTYSSLSAGSSSSNITLTDVKPKENQIYCFKIIPLTGDLHVELKQPAAVSRGGTEAQPLGFVDTKTIEYAKDGIVDIPVFATMENRQLIAVFKNVGTSTITPKLRFTGYRYEIEKVSETPAKYEEIIMEGIK